MLNLLWDLASFIVALGVLITVREFGHFWVVRRRGTRAERFSIRFGRVFWRRTDRLGTEYAIALIPLGGYVKMPDERVEPVAPEFRHHAFNSKSVDQRAAITVAGPVADFIFAISAYWLVSIIGMPGVRPVVGEIAINSTAVKVRIAPSTELRTVDGTETPDWDAVRLQLVDKIGDESITITVAPFGSDRRRDVKLDLRHWAFEPDKEDPVSPLGTRPRGPQIEPIPENVQPNSAVSKTDLQVGDRTVKVDGQPSTQWVTFMILVRDNPDKSSALEIEEQGSPLSLTLTPESKPGEGKVTSLVGIEPRVIPLSDEYRVVRQYGLFNAIIEAADKTWQLVRLMVDMLGRLVTSDVKLSNLGGPISIAKGAGMTAELGVVYYLSLLTLISVNLGIINLSPLPVLDGGYLLFLAIEKIKNGPTSGRVQDFCYRIGSILLVLLMGLTLFDDFPRL